MNFILSKRMKDANVEHCTGNTKVLFIFSIFLYITHFKIETAEKLLEEKETCVN